MATSLIAVFISLISMMVHYSGVDVSSYDAERRTDIDSLARQLEAFHAENGGYPMAISPLTLEFANPENFEDPKGRWIHNKPATAESTSARELVENHKGPGDYVYVAYGRQGCRTDCLGYFLKTKIATDDNETRYVRAGLRNP